MSGTCQAIFAKVVRMLCGALCKNPQLTGLNARLLGYSYKYERSHLRFKYFVHGM
jgi:hypothetical protein